MGKMADLDNLLEEARTHLEIGRDDKAWCSTEELITLLKAGAQPIRLNGKQMGNIYRHDVLYRGIRFVNATERRVRKLNKYLN